jgi:acetyl esterase/lipase
MAGNTKETCADPAEIPVDERIDGPGVSCIDPNDPSAPLYRLLAKMRSPLTLRDMMILPVRTGYISDKIDPADLPPSAEKLYPQVVVTEIRVPSPAGPVRCLVYTPPGSDTSRPMMLYLHGGGFTVGLPQDTAYITTRIAFENNLLVVSARYRLAPEWPFPAGMDDALAVLRWMRDHSHELGGDPTRIVAAGDSAGGNMAAALPIKARDEGTAMPDATLLLCPITDFLGEEYESFERLAPLGIIYDTPFFGFIRGAYVVHRSLWTHPHVSPARADLRGYPPSLIVSGTHDPMIDDNRAFADKLRDAGCRLVEHFVRDGMPHGYYFFPGVFKQGDEAFGAIRDFLGKTVTLRNAVGGAAL